MRVDSAWYTNPIRRTDPIARQTTLIGRRATRVSLTVAVTVTLLTGSTLGLDRGGPTEAANSEAQGIVTLRKPSCDYLLVETPMGYALLEWYGGNDPDEGDELVGPFEEYGFKDIYNLTADAELRVWVEDYWLGKTSALEQFYEECD